MSKQHLVYISAGEISGDRHAAALVKKLQSLNPELSFFGMGHKALKQANVEIIADISSANTIGFIEPIRHLPAIWKAYRTIKSVIKCRKPDLAILVDCQGFHVRLLNLFQSLQVPVIYYIPPQEWRWGACKDSKKVVQLTKKILSIFPKETDFYNKLGGNVVNVGHPLLRVTKPYQSRLSLIEKLGVHDHQQLIGVFPGSRIQEIERLYPLLLSAALQVAKKVAHAQVVVAISSPIYKSVINQLTPKNAPVIFYANHSYGLIPHLSMSYLASGTVSLEHACFGIPAVVSYRFSSLSFQFIKLFFSKKFKSLKWISLPNLILQEMLIPEFIQDDATINKLVEAGLPLLTDPKERTRQQKGFDLIRQQLGKGDPVDQAAREVLETLNEIQ